MAVMAMDKQSGKECPGRVAVGGQWAFTTVRLSGMAYFAAMDNDPVAEISPTLGGKQLADGKLYLVRIVKIMQTDPARDPLEVGIDHDTRLAISIENNAIRCFAADTRKSDQLVNRIRYDAIKLRQNLLRSKNYVFRLGAEKAEGFDIGFYILRLGGGESLG